MLLPPFEARKNSVLRTPPAIGVLKINHNMRLILNITEYYSVFTGDLVESSPRYELTYIGNL